MAIKVYMTNIAKMPLMRDLDVMDLETIVDYRRLFLDCGNVWK